MPLYTFLHSLLNVFVQMANKIGRSIFAQQLLCPLPNNTNQNKLADLFVLVALHIYGIPAVHLIHTQSICNFLACPFHLLFILYIHEGGCLLGFDNV
jgi:hypothetical protein